MPKCMIVVAFGNMMDGYEMFGPFEDEEGAAPWAEANAHGREWLLVGVMSPDCVKPPQG